MKKVLLGVLMVGLLVACYVRLDNLAKEQQQQEVQEYAMCIQEQSDTQGWIIRSACSSNYQVLDELANLEYEVVGKDLYLVK